MDFIQLRFLEAVKAALAGDSVTWPAGSVAPEQWAQLFLLAGSHHVLPLTYQAVYNCPAAASCPNPEGLKKQAIQTVLLQTVKTQEFAQLYRFLREKGLHPMLVKGLVCRRLYPEPDYRLSSDEDLRIPPEEFQRCQAALEAYGLCPGTLEGYEVPYTMPGSPLYIELHRSLFPPDSEAYGDMNRFFRDIHSRPAVLSAEGTDFITMPETEHLFYLICHAFKHFLHSGFGIRQVCDVCLFAEQYHDRIDFSWVLGHCRSIRAHLFAAAIFRIGQKHLGLGEIPPGFAGLNVEENLLLEDLLDAGVYGGATTDRLHSSTMTLHAVTAQKKGKKARPSLLRTVFPKADSLKGKYPYLEEKPYLLPLAWAQRLGKYGKENKNSAKSASASIALGARRVRLLTHYGILGEVTPRKRGKK